jgi:hypothetical protein
VDGGTHNYLDKGDSFDLDSIGDGELRFPPITCRHRATTPIDNEDSKRRHAREKATSFRVFKRHEPKREVDGAGAENKELMKESLECKDITAAADEATITEASTIFQCPKGYLPGCGKWKKIAYELFNMKVFMKEVIQQSVRHIGTNVYAAMTICLTAARESNNQGWVMTTVNTVHRTIIWPLRTFC